MPSARRKARPEKPEKPEKPVWPAMAPEMRRLSELKPYDRNARTHSPAQIKQLAASMREFGWTNPILVDEAGGIIAGHGRLEGAKALGWDKGPVIVARGWSEPQKRAYVLADNQLALAAGWDMALLAEEFAQIELGGFDVGMLGFTDAEQAKLRHRANAGLTDPEDVPEPPKDAVSRAGDLILLGRHRLVCGDSTNPEHVARALGDLKPHLMVTDPPYGVEYDANWRNGVVDKTGAVVGKVGRGARAVGAVLNDDRADWREAWSLFAGEVAYVWHAGQHARQVIESLNATGFEMRAQIIWAKTRFAIGRGDYHFQHEPCWYAVRKGATSNWQGDRSQTTLWSIAHNRSETGHSTQKPIEAMLRPMLNNSLPGDAVYDPFLGSGTSLIAAEMEGRRCVGLELNPVYCDVIAARWEAFPGRRAERVRE